MFVFVIANQKGGVGKTTSCVSIGAALAAKGMKVLLLDNDPQGHVGKSLGLIGAEGGGTTALYLDRTQSVGDVVEKLEGPGKTNISVIASTAKLAEAERDSANDLSGGLYRLGDRGEEFLKLKQDAILIDCPPNLGALALNAFVLASELRTSGWKGGVVVPVGMGMLDVDGLGRLRQSVEALETRGLAPGILALIPTMCEPQTLIARDVLNVLSHQYGEKVTRPVRKSIRFREAPAVGETIFEYDPQGHGAIDYAAVADDLIRLAEKNG
jgi:chromosome partitioning protein